MLDAASPLDGGARAVTLEIPHSYRLGLLWVVEDGSQMCDEQAALALYFPAFRHYLEAHLPGLELVTTVIPTSGELPLGKASTQARLGLPGCFSHRPYPCKSASDCESAFGPGWRCSQPSGGPEKAMNGAPLSECSPSDECVTDLDCCDTHCSDPLCDSASNCATPWCDDAQCHLSCVGENEWPGSGAGTCRPAVPIDSCPDELPAILGGAELSLMECAAHVGPGSSSAHVDRGLAAAWAAVAPTGAYPEQAAALVDPTAWFGAIFLTDEDDCSVDTSYCYPGKECETDQDCQKGSNCMLDPRFSEIAGEEKRVCCGALSSEFSRCMLLGEFRGAEHHAKAYDLTVDDCSVNEDCPIGWACKAVESGDSQAKTSMKCRPEIYAVDSVSSYQSPEGAPLFALASVDDYGKRFSTLLTDPRRLMMAAIVGDGIPGPDEDEALISQKCLEHPLLFGCHEYAQLKQLADADCLAAPAGEGCENFHAAMMDCIRECYTLAKGASTIGDAPHICSSSHHAAADLGARYIRFVQLFGDAGVNINLCGAKGMEDHLLRIARHMVMRMQRLCLPHDFDATADVTVRIRQRERGEQSAALTAGTDSTSGDYHIVSGVADCCEANPDDCSQGGIALYVHRPLTPDEVVEID